MKKNFKLTDPKHKPDRVIELIKAEVNKYLARERRKELPEGVEFWDFDCRCGKDEGSATAVKSSELGKAIDSAAAGSTGTIYVEILAKPGVRKR